MSVEFLKQQYLPKFLSEGKDRFYRILLFHQLYKILLIKKGLYKGVSPEIEYMEYYNHFLLLSRREGEESYLEMAKVFRKAAHKLYRILIKLELTEKNLKFLNLV